MSVDAVMARIGEIQSTIVGLTNTRPSVASQAAPTGSSASSSGDTFTQELAKAVSQQSATASASPSSSSVSNASPLESIMKTAVESASSTTPVSPTNSSDKVSKPDDEPKSSNGVNGSDVVATAKKHLGVPYVWGGNSPSQGFDCSGLVKHVMNELGVDMPRVARDQAKVGTEIASLSEAKPGDLLGMRNGSHIAIYLGDNKILHAPQPGEDVSIRSLFSWDDIDTIRRVVPADSQTSSASNAASRLAFDTVSA